MQTNILPSVPSHTSSSGVLEEREQVLKLLRLHFEALNNVYGDTHLRSNDSLYKDDICQMVNGLILAG